MLVTNGNKSGWKFGISLSACLFKAIKRFVKLTYFGCLSGRVVNHKAKREFHVYRFMKVSVKKSIIDVKLLKKPTFDRSQAEKSSDWCREKVRRLQ